MPSTFKELARYDQEPNMNYLEGVGATHQKEAEQEFVVWSFY